MPNPILVLQIRIAETILPDPICIELRRDVVPITVDHIINLVSTGAYEQSGIHRVDTDNHSLIGGLLPNPPFMPRYFSDENYELKHTAGAVSLRHFMPNMNYSQFSLLMKERPQFDGKQVVFGYVLQGEETLKMVHSSRLGKRGAPMALISFYKVEIQAREGLPKLSMLNPRKHLKRNRSSCDPEGSDDEDIHAPMDQSASIKRQRLSAHSYLETSPKTNKKAKVNVGGWVWKPTGSKFDPTPGLPANFESLGTLEHMLYTMNAAKHKRERKKQVHIKKRKKNLKQK